MEKRLIYLDNNATTPCDPRVVEVMLIYFTEQFGNPSNALNWMGREAARAVDNAREQVAESIGARTKEVVFTASATEANNLAILGFCRRNRSVGRNKIITTQIEHKSVLRSFEKLRTEGMEVVTIPVDAHGIIELEEFTRHVDEHTLLVSVQAVNNEIGTIQPIDKVAELAHENGAIFHCDASQAIGKTDINISNSIDLMSISAHKFYGPKGIGALYGRGKILTQYLEPLIYGGGQERDVRPGTYNVPLIVGMGKAAQLVRAEMTIEIERIRAMRDTFESNLMKQVPNALINGKNALRIANTSNITILGVDADALLLNCPELMMGTGSACNAGAIEPSYVLTAMGIDRTSARSSIRVGFGRFNAPEDPPIAANQISAAVERLTY